MSNAVHFFRRSTITRKHRPMTKAVVDTLTSDDYANGITVEVDGCIVTNTSKYIDFASGLPLSELYDMSYGRVYDGETAYLFFVDSIEPNNFNEVGNTYYRAYITIDWWSTLLYRHGDDNNIILSQIINRIEGEVERAHVNDIQKLGNELYPTLINTFKLREENITDSYITGDNICFNDGADNGDGILWWYFLFAFDKNAEDEIKTTVLSGSLSNYSKRHTVPCGLGFMPIKDGMTTFLQLGQTKNFYASSIPVNTITDPRIIHSFVSKIPPANYTANYENIGGDIGAGWLVRMNYHKDTSIIDDIEVGKVILETSTDERPFPQLSFIEGVIYNLSTLLSTYSIKDRPLCRQLLSKPSNYSEYSRLVVKAKSEVYNIFVISSGSTSISIPLISSQRVYMGINYESGSIIGTYTDYLNSSEFGRNFNVGDDITFDPVQKIDRWKVFSGVINAGSNIGSSIGGLIEGNALKTYGGITDTIRVLGDTIIQNRGAYSTQPTGLLQTANVNLPNYVVTIPANIADITTNLMIYGYNTPLRFSTIFYNHRRKYYNYIKMVKCDMSSSRFTEEIRQSIEQMFEGGVWLWNSVTAPATDRSDGVTSNNSMGYLFLNNYPLVIDE